MIPRLWMLSGVTAVAILACKGKDQTTDRDRAAGQEGMAGMRMDSMPMGGGQMGMGGSGMMAMMRAHMDSMTRMSPERMTGMMAGHDRMMSQMMDRMGSDMRSMKMSGNAEWDSLTDSVKADLAELPGLKGEQLSARVKAHTDRVRRLMTLHEGMMKGM